MVICLALAAGQETIGQESGPSCRTSGGVLSVQSSECHRSHDRPARTAFVSMPHSGDVDASFCDGRVWHGGDALAVRASPSVNLKSGPQRRRLFRELLLWAAQQRPASDGASLPLVLWTVDGFDPIGVSSHGKDRVADDEIAHMIQTYSRWRCSKNGSLRLK